MKRLLFAVLLLIPLLAWSTLPAAAADVPGDANGDGQVDVQDLTLVAAHFNTSPPGDARADLNGDGVVNIFDLALVGLHYGRANVWTTYSNFKNVISIAIDGQGLAWFSTSGGVSVFDGSTWVTYNTKNSGLASDYVRAIVIDGEGQAWFGTGGGVSVFDGSTWTTYTTQNTVGSNNVVAIAIDSQDRLWFGTWSGGNCRGI